MREISKLVLVLSLICGISAAALTVVRISLEERIDMQNDFYVRGPALEQLFQKPANDVLKNKIVFSKDDITYPIFYMTEGDLITGLAIEAPGRGGYAGDIIIIMGIDTEAEKIIGLEIIQHSETPGVGSKVEKVSFRKQWINLSINESVELRTYGGVIDAISGATYSSNAVVDGTNRVKNIINQHLDEIEALIQANLD
jgi:electron transport complex protein RnfG